MAVYKITGKEYKRIQELQQTWGIHDHLLFKLPDGTHYKCNERGGKGLKEIMRFRKKAQAKETELKMAAESQTDLLAIPDML